MSDHQHCDDPATEAQETGIPRPRRGEEGGYVAPMAALLLIPLMIFAALAVDVGSWYIRADQMQKAADASSLAGTVWLPDLDVATQVALDTAARNGFRNGDNATVVVPGVTVDDGLIVEIEAESPSYFGIVVLDKITIRRQAVAKVIPPVRLGNPSNAMGTGNLSSGELGIPPDGIWLGLNGFCSDHENGDPFSVEHYGARLSGGSRFLCGEANRGANPTYDLDAYTFVVDIPPGAGQVALEIFEPGLCVDANPGDNLFSAEEGVANGPPLRARVYANDNTLRYDTDNLTSGPVADVTYPINACTGGSGAGGRWYHIHTIGAGAASEGRWYMRVNAVPGTSYTNMNMFALRARPTSDGTLCSSMTDATCPQIYAKDWLPLWRPDYGTAAVNQVAEFFLAHISDDYAGKTVEIKMFDPGEGMDNIQILDPDGTIQTFRQHLSNCSVGLICGDNGNFPESGSSGNDLCSGAPCLDVTSNAFQDMWVTLEIDLPANYECGVNCWWKVRYTPVSGGVVSDRTTWSVRVIGDPVHLIE